MIQSVRVILSIAVLVSASLVAEAQDVDAVFEGMIEAENSGYRTIDNYLLKTETLGMSTFEYYEKTSSLQMTNGQTVYIMRNVPPGEIHERATGGNPISNASAAELRAAADMIESQGAIMEQGLMEEMGEGELPGGIGTMLANPSADQPWLSPNPRSMTSMYAAMLEGSANAKDAQAAEDGALVGDTQRQAQAMSAIQAQSRITGHRQFNGSEVIEIGAADLNFTQTEGDVVVTWNSVNFLVHADRLVPLLFTMNGVINDGGESRPITIEREDQDYRSVAGCGDMYRPFKSIMRLGGMMTPEQQAELAEASAQLEQLEAQMASMPASQRKMMESMMGPQLEMIKNMASGGGIEVVSTIAELRCNTGLPDPIEIANTMFGGTFGTSTAPTSTARTPGQDDYVLAQSIQRDLKTLGYEPGSTSGELTKNTVVAITKFQASQGIEITGQPSPQLAEILQASVAGLSSGELTTDYLSGFWCTESVQEKSLYNFAADGSYRLGVVGLTITQAGGTNYFPETFSRQSFLDNFDGVLTSDRDRFTVLLTNGKQEIFSRGNCFE